MKLLLSLLALLITTQLLNQITVIAEYNTCSGPIITKLYKSCRHEQHGVELYNMSKSNSCIKYKSCLNIKHGISNTLTHTLTFKQSFKTPGDRRDIFQNVKNNLDAQCKSEKGKKEAQKALKLALEKYKADAPNKINQRIEFRNIDHRIVSLMKRDIWSEKVRDYLWHQTCEIEVQLDIGIRKESTHCGIISHDPCRRVEHGVESYLEKRTSICGNEENILAIDDIILYNDAFGPISTKIRFQLNHNSSTTKSCSTCDNFKEINKDQYITCLENNLSNIHLNNLQHTIDGKEPNKISYNYTKLMINEALYAVNKNLENWKTSASEATYNNVWPSKLENRIIWAKQKNKLHMLSSIFDLATDDEIKSLQRKLLIKINEEDVELLNHLYFEHLDLFDKQIEAKSDYDTLKDIVLNKKHENNLTLLQSGLLFLKVFRVYASSVQSEIIFLKEFKNQIEKGIDLSLNDYLKQIEKVIKFKDSLPKIKFILEQKKNKPKEYNELKLSLVNQQIRFKKDDFERLNIILKTVNEKISNTQLLWPPIEATYF